MGRHTGHRRKAKPKQSTRSYLPRRTPPLRSDLLPLSRPPTISCRGIIAAAARARAARRHGGQELPRRRWWHVGSIGDGAVEKGGGKAGDGARGDGALWRRCGSVQRAGRHMKVALALSPENAVEAPSSLTSRVRGTWPDRQVACMRRPAHPRKGFCEETLHAKKRIFWSRSAVSLRARS
jgi:hypothetical protein